MEPIVPPTTCDRFEPVRRRYAALVLAAAVPLVACSRELAIDLKRQDGGLAITATRGGSARPPCVQGVVVTVAGADIAATPPLWEVATAEPGRCRTGFRYGEVPPGYSQSGPAPRLVAGRRYMVELSGPGLQGGAEFTMRDADGALTP